MVNPVQLWLDDTHTRAHTHRELTVIGSGSETRFLFHRWVIDFNLSWLPR